MSYTVYIVRCADASLYTGIARDVQARIRAHNTSSTGAKYTRSRRPVELVYTEDCADRGTALQREHAIRTLSRSDKMQLIATQLSH